MPSDPAPTRTKGDASLAPVRAAVPAACYRRSTRRGLAAAGRDGALYLGTLVALALVDAWWLVLPLAGLAGLFVAGLFVLAHDASHGTLTDDDRLNRLLGRTLMLPSLHLEAAWDLGHNRVHHGYTARQGMDFVWHPLTADEYRALSRWHRLRHRVEWSALGAGAYYLREVWWNKMVTFRAPTRHAAAIGQDRRLVGGWVVGTAGIAVGGGLVLGTGVAAGLVLWLKLVVAPFLVFTQIIGWTVYVHHIGPDIPWWTRAQWTRRRAQTESTTVLLMPKPLGSVLHHIFVHVPHHVDTRIPWYRLPEAAAAIAAAFPDAVVEKRFRLRDYLTATRTCKLYDFERQRWSGYGPATAATERPTGRWRRSGQAGEEEAAPAGVAVARALHAAVDASRPGARVAGGGGVAS